MLHMQQKTCCLDMILFTCCLYSTHHSPLTDAHRSVSPDLPVGLAAWQDVNRSPSPYMLEVNKGLTPRSRKGKPMGETERWCFQKIVDFHLETWGRYFSDGLVKNHQLFISLEKTSRPFFCLTQQVDELLGAKYLGFREAEAVDRPRNSQGQPPEMDVPNPIVY